MELNKQRAIIYSRCSTDENKQDTEIQLQELRRYCNAFGWSYDEVSEYGSGFKGEQPKLKEILKKIKAKQYDILIVYSMDRFSREHPSKTNALLDTIVYDYKCRFIARQENIDSDNEMTWNVIKPMFVYFANVFSRNLSNKVKLGIKRKKELNQYKGGRPTKSINTEELNTLYKQFKSLRRTAEAYNKDKPKKERISYVTVKKTLKNFNTNNSKQTEG